MRKSVLCLLLTLLALQTFGCAKPKMLTREESLALRQKQIEISQRFFPEKTKDDVLIAAGGLFHLCDGSDFQIQHTPDGMIARRNWLVYMVIAAAMGTDYWYLRAEETPEGTLLIARANTMGSAVSAVPTNSNFNGVAPMTVPPVEQMIQSEALYTLFFNRMDYLLGRSKQWQSCSEFRESIKGTQIKGILDPLCIVTDDDYPEGYPIPESAKAKSSYQPMGMGSSNFK